MVSPDDYMLDPPEDEEFEDEYEEDEPMSTKSKVVIAIRESTAVGIIVGEHAKAYDALCEMAAPQKIEYNDPHPEADYMIFDIREIDWIVYRRDIGYIMYMLTSLPEHTWAFARVGEEPNDTEVMGYPQEFDLHIETSISY